MTAADLAAIATVKPWLTADEAAVYLGYARRQYLERVAVQPGFPQPTYFGGKSARWRRADLDAWAEAQPERRTVTPSS